MQRVLSLGGGVRAAAAASAASASALRVSGARFLHVHEFQSHELLRRYQVATVRGYPATTADEAAEAARRLGGRDFVVKAQCLAGGRGKGTFKNGFKGGVHIANCPSQVRDISDKMIGQVLVTKQTGEAGRPVSTVRLHCCEIFERMVFLCSRLNVAVLPQVYIAERLFLRRECYFAILLDRASKGPVMIASPSGGMDIEAVAEQTPELIFRESIENLEAGATDEQLNRLAYGMGFGDEGIDHVKKVIKGLYNLFMSTDATLVEINPLVETHDNQVCCADAKLNFDDNASFRQRDIFRLRDTTQEDPREVAASDYGLNYIGLDGNIGCLVNGAGLAMATMDVIKLHGGSPANFLDLGGGASETEVTKAFEILNSDDKVKAILVNIFGGIMRCDVIALGLIKAATEIGLKKPLVVRLEGTNVEKANTLIEDSGLRMMTCEDMEDAAKKCVRVAEIVKMAEDVNVEVHFELPL